MCFGGPKPPKVKYQGPSKDDIRRQEESLARYEREIASQQQTFQTRLQAQIDAANQQTAELQAKYDADLAAQEEAAAAAEAAAGSEAAAEQVGAYAVTTQQTEAEDAQTTEEIDKKKKPKANLKISTAGAAAQVGSGLNIGV